ncbi:MAG TPA: SDR family NAD(P)-dependent oxidoreductase [Geminicoccaceae bacterium]|nr:SDR family NAD(P)-dependent oxidoreductase [Geminicoccaceae bacterium]
MGQELAGRTALVTGGSRGIGRAVCVRLAEEGARVGINYANNAEAARATERLVRAAGAECALLPADVSDPDAVAAMVAEAERALGPIDLLVTSAGIAPAEVRGEVSFETWRRTMAVNVDGTFLPIMAVKDGMIARGFGRIVCFASIAGLRPRPAMLAYGTSKAAVIAFARSCSEAFAPHVRINCIAPGLIDTEMPAHSLDAATRQRMIDATPLGRIGRPEEMAELALFLLSERSSFTTGQVYVADGGRVTLP